MALISANRLALVAGLAAALLALLAGVESAYACLCASSGSPAEALERADAVFAGKVTSITFKGTSPYRLSSAEPVEVEFRVKRVWKGPRRETMTVDTDASGISCGYQFKKGQTYIVYATDGYTGMCSRTAPAWMAFADLVALGEGWRPVTATTAGTAGGGTCLASASPGDGPTDVTALGLVAGVVALSMRRRPRL